MTKHSTTSAIPLAASRCDTPCLPLKLDIKDNRPTYKLLSGLPLGQGVACTHILTPLLSEEAQLPYYALPSANYDTLKDESLLCYSCTPTTTSSTTETTNSPGAGGSPAQAYHVRLMPEEVTKRATMEHFLRDLSPEEHNAVVQRGPMNPTEILEAPVPCNKRTSTSPSQST